MWTQVLTACLNVIQGMNTRIAEFQNPSAAAPPPQPQQNSIQSLPRISAPIKEDNIFTNPPPPSSRREMVQTNVGTLTKSYGQNPRAKLFSIPSSPRAKQFLETGKDKVLTQEQQQAPFPGWSPRHFQLLPHAIPALTFRSAVPSDITPPCLRRRTRHTLQQSPASSSTR
jgi:nucleoporin NDC1